MINILLQHIESVISISSLRKSILLIDFTTSIRAIDCNYSFYSSKENNSGYNLGIHRIGAYLHKFNVPVKIIRYDDFKNKTEELFLLVAKADIIGINSFSFSINVSYKLCVKIKNKFPDKIIIGGAEHYALDFKWILENQSITGCDICCTMQGELPMLALSLGIQKTKIGSIAYFNSGNVLKNPSYPALNDNTDKELLKPVPVLNISKDLLHVAFPEFHSTFKTMGLTQTGSGCIFLCDFCTNHFFMGNKFNETLNTAKLEINYFIKNKINFFFIANTLLNSNKQHLNDFLEYIESENSKRKIYWSCFYSVRNDKDLQQFKRLANSGCLMINVGVEDIIGERENLKKGAKTIDAIEFTENAKKYLLVRTLLILGLPNHYSYSRDELKEKFLSYMKKHPQAIYRINHFTPIFGTSDFKKYESLLEVNPRDNTDRLTDFDTLHPLLNPIKMYESLNIVDNKRWLRNASDWSQLQKEIITEYISSEEHQKFMLTLKENKILYKIAESYSKLVLNG
ncbi:MAG: hypothetical protein WCL70_03400 [Paludibacter sp.]